eukprot:TRINITY_DN5100_c0_g1::TRINITY_DN5100_c0_g1_i1::g.24888::m.24888 TRINITY_DN5100_c0_g1::TRINITY_DN5100_c0_g1_i1::g.24888  ORF type:complete len:628 (+),score=172.39,sp/Q32KH7/ARSI_CANLF/34.95/3e-70,Sulfatase/PF00884.18/6.4e-58,Phosphodiest/PF01663.17/0.47,Phosphodiest/PF01663.17/0.0068,Sulfatase_C/PF14707.1/0.0035,IncA/PF04156.9/0.16 TRINITY_DN5100_c0_g1_i1:32-1885(+)
MRTLSPLILCLLVGLVASVAEKPDIFVILADDMGYGDIGYNGSPIPTPNLDKLANSGVKLTTHYSNCVCSPSRAALLTGRYASNVGFNLPLLGGSPFGMDPNLTTLPEELKKEGYETVMLGKWHLGHAKRAFLPTQQGFDVFVGSYLAANGFFSKKIGPAIDLHRGEEPYVNSTHYSTLIGDEASQLVASRSAVSPRVPIFMYLAFTAPHTPLQPDEESLGHCQHIGSSLRRRYCGLVVGLDRAVGQLVDTLHSTRRWDTSVIIFMSDNGAVAMGGGVNFPFKGQKNSAYEGAVRTPAFISGGHAVLDELERAGLRGSAYPGIVHISDWFPTIMSLAKQEIVNVSQDEQSKRSFPSDPDGIDMTGAIFGNRPSPRTEVLIALDKSIDQYVLRVGRYKLIDGRSGDPRIVPEPKGNWMLDVTNPELDVTWVDRFLEAFGVMASYVGDVSILVLDIIREIQALYYDYRHGTHYAPFFPFLHTGSPDMQLYDVESDPSEQRDLAKDPQYAEIMLMMTRRLASLKDISPPVMDGDIMDPQRTFEIIQHENTTMKSHGPWLSDDDDMYAIAEARGVSFLSKFYKLLGMLLGGLVVVLSLLSLTVCCCCCRRRRPSVTKSKKD